LKFYYLRALCIVGVPMKSKKSFGQIKTLIENPKRMKMMITPITPMERTPTNQ